MPRPGATRLRDLRPRLSVSQTVGAYSLIKIPEWDTYDQYTAVTARTVYVGLHCIVLEDSASALAGQIDSSYRELGVEFDQVTFPMLQQNFGNPLAMDQYTDHNGRVIMLFSPVINQKYPDIFGFVSACDFFDESVCPASNHAELFYAIAPTSALADYSEGSVSWWRWNIREVIAHESEHITSYAEKLSRSTNPVFEAAWLDEGLAQVAAELYGRQIYGVENAGWRSDAGYARTIYCDLRPSWPECLDHPIVMYDHFSWLYDFTSQIDTHSPIDPADGTIYGSAWLLARWAADTYASNEGSFFRSLVQQASDSGRANLEAHTGVSRLARAVRALGAHLPHRRPAYTVGAGAGPEHPELGPPRHLLGAG